MKFTALPNPLAGTRETWRDRKGREVSEGMGEKDERRKFEPLLRNPAYANALPTVLASRSFFTTRYRATAS